MPTETNTTLAPYDWHVCLVSEQALQNWLPMLEPGLKPRQALLLVTPQMRERAQLLTDALQPRGVKVERMAVDGHARAEAENALLAWLARHEGERIALNATGGTKLLSFAAAAAFDAAGMKDEVFYVHLDTGTAEWLFRGDAPPVALEARITLREMLALHGTRIMSECADSLSAAERDLAYRLRDLSLSDGNALARLNGMAVAARDKGLRAPIGACDTHFNYLLGALADAGAARIEGDTLVFTNEAMCQLAAGGWAEALAFAAAQSLAGELKLRDVRRNVVVQQGSVTNELDVVFMSGRRLHVVECKTARDASAAPARNRKGTDMQDTIHKIDALSKLAARLNVRPALLSVQALSPASATRARENRVRVLSGADLGNLEGALRAWVQQP